MIRPSYIGAAVLATFAIAIAAVETLGPARTQTIAALVMLVAAVLAFSTSAIERSRYLEAFVFWSVIALCAASYIPTVLAWL